MPKLIYNKAPFAEVKKGDRIIRPDKETFIVEGYELPHSINSSGRVHGYYAGAYHASGKYQHTGHESLFPHALGLKIVDYCPSCGMESDDFHPNPDYYSIDGDDPFNAICGACGWKVTDPRMNETTTEERDDA